MQLEKFVEKYPILILILKKKSFAVTDLHPAW